MANMPAARSALRVLTLLAEQSGPVRAATIARALDLPRSSTYQLLEVMRDEGFLIHYPELQAFGPSSRVHQIGTRVLAAHRLAALGQPVIDRLVQRAPTPATAHLAVLAGADVAYAARGQGPRSPLTVSRVGVRLPAASTATGRALLSALDPDQVRAIIPSDSALAGLSITRRRTLTEVLAQTRERGYAIERGDVDPDYGSTASAALDATGYPAAAVGLTFRLSDVNDDDWRTLGEATMAAARELSLRLGARSTSP